MGHHKYSDEEFLAALRQSVSMRNLINLLEMCVSSWNYKNFYKRIQHLRASTDHWKGQTREDCLGNLHSTTSRSLDQILIENSPVTGAVLRRNILKSKILEYKCAICGIDEWNGKNLSLQIDHKNGCRTDDRIENLQWLCPNCHTQTETWGTKRRRNRCVDCNAPLSHKKSSRCRVCAGIAFQKTKIEWPSNDQLLLMVENSSFVRVAQQLGVSDNAIRKRLKKRLGWYPNRKNRKFND